MRPIAMQKSTEMGEEGCKGTLTYPTTTHPKHSTLITVGGRNHVRSSSTPSSSSSSSSSLTSPLHRRYSGNLAQVMSDTPGFKPETCLPSVVLKEDRKNHPTMIFSRDQQGTQASKASTKPLLNPPISPLANSTRSLSRAFTSPLKSPILEVELVEKSSQNEEASSAKRSNSTEEVRVNGHSKYSDDGIFDVTNFFDSLPPLPDDDVSSDASLHQSVPMSTQNLELTSSLVSRFSEPRIIIEENDMPHNTNGKTVDEESDIETPTTRLKKEYSPGSPQDRPDAFSREPKRIQDASDYASSVTITNVPCGKSDTRERLLEREGGLSHVTVLGVKADTGETLLEGKGGLHNANFTDKPMSGKHGSPKKCTKSVTFQCDSNPDLVLDSGEAVYIPDSVLSDSVQTQNDSNPAQNEPDFTSNNSKSKPSEQTNSSFNPKPLSFDRNKSSTTRNGASFEPKLSVFVPNQNDNDANSSVRDLNHTHNDTHLQHKDPNPIFDSKRSSPSRRKSKKSTKPLSSRGILSENGNFADDFTHGSQGSVDIPPETFHVSVAGSQGTPDDEDVMTFAGRRDVKDVRSAREKQIVSGKGTVRGYRNRVRAGIETFLNPTKFNYQALERDKIIVYTSSVTVVRATHERCKVVRFILHTHMVRYEQRDVYMCVEHQRQLRERLDDRDDIPLPQIFIDGLHLGGAKELEKLNETGELRTILHRFPKIQQRSQCVACGGHGFVPCGVCRGSKKSVHRNHFTEEFCALRCMNCNENGLQRCHECLDQ